MLTDVHMHIRPKAQAMPSKHFPARDGAASSAPKIKETDPLGTPPKPAREPNCGGRLLPPREAADFLRVSESWLAKARMRGDGPPYVKVGRSIRYAEGALLQWIKSRVHLSTSER
jgi:predicted DNA-binding transcriptional regulator AlpA